MLEEVLSELPTEDTIAAGNFYFGLLMLFVSIVAAVISGCLIHGARTRSVCLMKPWIVMTGISLVLSPLFIIFALVTLPMKAASCAIALWGCYSYFWRMVWLYKDEVENGNGRRGYLKGWKLYYKGEDGEELKA